MSEAELPIEWYLARDGQQHGPISAAEMNKIIELGYLLPTDLVWRYGFPDWQPAGQVFPLTAPPPPPPAAQARAPQAASGRPSESGDPATAPLAQRPAPDPVLPPEEDARAVVAREAARREEAQRRQREEEAQRLARQQEEAARRRAAEAASPEAGVTRPTQPVTGPRAEAPRQEAFTPGGPRQPMPGAEAQPVQHQRQAMGTAPASLSARLEPLSAGQPAAPRTSDPIRHGATGAPLREAYHGPGGPAAPRLDLPPPTALPPAEAIEEPRARRRFPWAAALAALFLAGGGAALYALHHTGQLKPVLAMVGLGSHEALTPKSADRRTGRAPTADPPPAEVLRSGYASTPGEVDAAFQKLPLWQLLKRDFPDWYRDRVNETARLKSEGKADLNIAQHLAERLVELRRKHVADALAASPSRLKLVATTFLENLERLNKHSIDACYGFISQGETHPLIVELMRASEHAPALQAQAAAVFQAIVEGRRAPMKHAQPTREDYDKLATQLSRRGWSPADLQLFSDARSLSRAPPERVCKMVQDWFAAQLAVSEEDVQVRLLIEALKPVVAG